MARILLIDQEDDGPASIRRTLASQGHEVEMAADPLAGLAAARILPPDLLVLDIDPARHQALDVCETISRRERTCGMPILAITASRSLGEAEEFFHRGVSAILTRPVTADALQRKVEALLEPAGPDEADRLGIPPPLDGLFARLREEAAQLGDMAEIYAGISPRHQRFRRQAMVAENWKRLLTPDDIAPFNISEPETWIRFDRFGLLRVPGRDEYDHPEKVVLHRVAPPVTAAVDHGRHPVSAELYAIIPASGLACGFLACLLGSRLIDFYLNRVRPIQATPAGTYLRRIDIEAIPILLPNRQQSAKFLMLAKALAGAPASSARKERSRFLRDMNTAVFDVYGVEPAAIQRLGELHF